MSLEFETYLEVPMLVDYDWDEDTLYIKSVTIQKKSRGDNMVTNSVDIVDALPDHYIRELKKDALKHWEEYVKKQMEPDS